MKHLIILISLLTAPLMLQAQEYKVTCERVTGCPVVNGTCPTCTIVSEHLITDEEIDEWGKRMQENNKYVPLENDDPGREQSGWEWEGPTWRGLRVLY